jgi:mannose-6-phosphate isomerase-like protein (cupin superfamily)
MMERASAIEGVQGAMSIEEPSRRHNNNNNNRRGKSQKEKRNNNLERKTKRNKEYARTMLTVKERGKLAKMHRASTPESLGRQR